MTYDFFMGQVRLIAIGIISYLAGSGRLSSADASAATAILTPIGLLAAPWLWSLYQNFNTKLVPRSSTAIDIPPEAMPSKGATVQNVTAKVVGILLFMVIAPSAFGADLATKAAVVQTGYPAARCGMFYGLGTGGNAGAVKGAVAGTQIVQGDLDILIGYTCPFAQNAFWFVEGSFGFANLNGSQNGLALSGPLVAIERFGVGSPLNDLIGGILPVVNFPALPALPAFPGGPTPSTAPQSYAFAGLVEQDIGAQIGLLSGHQWVIAPMIGVGMLTRFNNSMVVDVWAGWQMNSNSFCPGGGQVCANLGNMARVGLSLKY